MINKKLLITLLVFSLLIILYVVNQFLFLSILVDSGNTSYAWVDKEYDGYLVSDSPDYFETAKNIDNNTDTCVIFLDKNTSKAAYTTECDKEKNVYVSESIRNEPEAISFDAIYEYLYGINYLSNIEGRDETNFPRYNEIYTKDAVKLEDLIPESVNYAQENRLYTTYSEDYKTAMLSTQIKVLMVAGMSLLVIFIYGYINAKKKEFYVFKVLGVNDNLLMKIIGIDILYMITISFFIALLIFIAIVHLNGNIFYMSMFWEYFNSTASIAVYILLILLAAICLIMYYIYLNVRRLKYD